MAVKVVCIDEMSIEELELHIIELSNEVYNSEWQYEFTRQEIREIRGLIEAKKQPN